MIILEEFLNIYNSTQFNFKTFWFTRYDTVDLSAPPKHWKDPNLSSSVRQNFIVSEKLSGLRIKNIKLEDEGKYRCRVDFEHQQTVIWWVNLTVIGIMTLTIISSCLISTIPVPPDKPRISQPKNGMIKDRILDILAENVTISLQCKVSGGTPRPAVTWWKDRVLIDSSWER